MQKKIHGLEAFQVREVYLPPDYPFPTLYKAFYSSYEIGMDKIKLPGVYLSQVNQVARIVQQRVVSEFEFMIHGFLSTNEIETFVSNTYEEDDEIPSRYIPIAECDGNQALLVGIASDNYDQIFLENLELFEDDTRIKLLADNIFSFLPNVQYWEKEKIGYGIAGYSSLYKNWDEDFWRVKETGE